MHEAMTWRVLVCLGALTAAACSGKIGEATGGEGGAGKGAGGNVGQGGGGAVSSSSGSGAGSTSSSSSGAASSSGASSSGASSSGASSSSSSSSSSGAADPYEAQRQACIDKINALRATKGLQPLTRWKAAEPCLDQQATYDEMNNKPHGAWIGNKFPACNGSGQNECLGQGPNGIESCLDQMWAEKNQAGCSGCDACSGAYDPNCPNCDFYGNATGDVCGHYVNMSAQYFTMAGCGFSSLGGWDVINFQ